MRRRAVFISALILCSAAHGNIVSNFDVGAEGWTAANVSFPGLSLLESHPAGWTSGHLAETEASFSLPGLFVLAAPSAYRGDLSPYYGGHVSFSLTDATYDSTQYASLLLQGNGLALGYRAFAADVLTPGYAVPLTATGWTTLSGTTVTEAQFKGVLAHLSVFAINADWTSGGTDVVTLDNVAVAAVPEPATMAGLGLGLLGVLRRRRAYRPRSK